MSSLPLRLLLRLPSSFSFGLYDSISLLSAPVTLPSRSVHLSSSPVHTQLASVQTDRLHLLVLLVRLLQRADQAHRALECPTLHLSRTQSHATTRGD